MRYLGLVASIIAVLFLLSRLADTQMALMQENLAPDLEVLSPENAHRLTEIARYGNGMLTGAAAWSPDGMTLAVGGSLGIWFYDMANPHGPPDLFDLDQSVMDLVFLNNGQYLAYTTSDETQIIDVETRSELHTFPEASVIEGHSNDNYLLIDSSVTLSGEGYTDVVSSLELWDVKQWKLIREFAPLSDYVYGLHIADLAVSSDGRYFAASYSGYAEDTCGHRTSSVFVWDSSNPDEAPFYLGGAEYVVFSPDSSVLVSAEWNSWGPDIAQLHVLNLETYEDQILATYPPEDDYWGYVTWFDFDPVSRQLMTLTDGALRFWDLSTSAMTREIELGMDIDALYTYKDGRVIAVSEYDLEMWRNDFREQQSITFDSPFASVEFLDSGNGLSLLDDDSQLHLWRLDEHISLEETFISEPLAGTDNAISLSENGDYVAYQTPDAVRIVETSENRPVREIVTASYAVVQPVAFSSDGQAFLLRSVENADNNRFVFQVWHVASGEMLREFGPYEQLSATEGVAAAQLNADGSWIGIHQQLSSRYHNRYTVFSISSGEEIYSYETESGFARWTPDLRGLIMNGDDWSSSTISYVDPLNPIDETKTVFYSYPGHVAGINQEMSQFFFITSSYTGCGGDYRNLYVHTLPDLQHGWSRSLPMGGWGTIDGLFSRTGSLVFSANSLLDATTGELLTQLPRGYYSSVTFGGDDRFLITGHKGIVRLWGVPSTEE